MRRKKILIVIGSFKIGGAERMSITIGEELISRGYDVHFALLRPIFEVPHSFPKDRIHPLSNRTGSSSRLQHISNLIAVFKLNLKLKVDFAIGFTYFSSFVACFSFCKNVIGTFDVFPYQFAKKRARVADFVIRWPFVKKIICPSEGLLNQLKEYRPNFESKGLYIYNTLDFNWINLKSAENINIGNLPPKYIVAMGRFSNQKNFKLLLQGFSKSCIKHAYKLVLIGDGPLKSQMLALIDEYKLQEYVILTGFLNNPFPIIRNSSFFINTSNYESFCMVILEALSLNIPVVATNCKSGPSEMIKDNVNGRLFPVGDLDALIEILNEINSFKSIIEKWQEEIPEKLKKFHLSNVVDEWESELFKIE